MMTIESHGKGHGLAENVWAHLGLFAAVAVIVIDRDTPGNSRPSLSILVGRHGAINPAGRVRCNMRKIKLGNVYYKCGFDVRQPAGEPRIPRNKFESLDGNEGCFTV
jgi:hypothetical protein